MCSVHKVYVYIIYVCMCMYDIWLCVVCIWCVCIWCECYVHMMCVLCICVCVYGTFTWVCHVCTCRDQSRCLLYCSPSITLRQGLSKKQIFPSSWKSSWYACLCPTMLGLQWCATMPVFLCGCWDSNSDPQAFRASTPTHWSSSQPLSLLLMPFPLPAFTFDLLRIHPVSFFLWHFCLPWHWFISWVYIVPGTLILFSNELWKTEFIFCESGTIVRMFLLLDPYFLWDCIFFLLWMPLKTISPFLCPSSHTLFLSLLAPRVWLLSCFTIEGLPRLLPHLRDTVPTPSCILKAEYYSIDFCKVQEQVEKESLAGDCGPPQLWHGMELCWVAFLFTTPGSHLTNPQTRATQMFSWVTSLRIDTFSVVLF